MPNYFNNNALFATDSSSSHLVAQKLWNDTQRIKATMPSKCLLIKLMRYIQTFKKQSLKNVYQIYFLGYSQFILSPELLEIVGICRFMTVTQKINPLNCFFLL